MTDQASFALRGRNPDVLTCIANLSNDDVLTPPEFASRMLDTLADAWAASHDGASLWASLAEGMSGTFRRTSRREFGHEHRAFAGSTAPVDRASLDLSPA